MFTRRVLGKKKSKRIKIVSDKKYVYQRIEKAKKNFQTRICISGVLSTELKRELLSKGYRIIEFECSSINYTVISW